MTSKPPREVEMMIIGCKCDYCGKELVKNKVWIWNEFFACSRDHVIRAQAESNKDNKEKDGDLL